MADKALRTVRAQRAPWLNTDESSSPTLFLRQRSPQDSGGPLGDAASPWRWTSPSTELEVGTCPAVPPHLRSGILRLQLPVANRGLEMLCRRF